MDLVMIISKNNTYSLILFKIFREKSYWQNDFSITHYLITQVTSDGSLNFGMKLWGYLRVKILCYWIIYL